MRWFRFLLPFLLTGCLREAADPFSLTPMTPYSSWTPMQGNTLISSKYCKTHLPPTFDSKELSLAELIDIALQNNPSTRASWAKARMASAKYGESLSPFFPNIGVNGSFLRQKGTFIQLDDSFPFFITQTGPDVTLTYTLFDFGQRTAAAANAREALYFADFSHNQNLQTVLQQVMNDYYNYLYEKASLTAKEADLQTAQSSLDAANEKFALGLVALGDVAQARTQFLQSKINLTTQRQAVEDAFCRLAVDLGLPSTLSFKVQLLPEKIHAEPLLEGIEELVQKAQGQRQDFLAIQADVRAKEAALLGAKRATLPVLSSTLDVGYYWFEKGLREESPHWDVSLSLTFPLFKGFYYKNGVRSAEAALATSKAYMLEKELSIVQMIVSSHMRVKTSAENVNDAMEYLKAAELEFNIALTSYGAGTTSILDVLSAQGSLADARLKSAEAKRSWFISLVALAYATGSLCPTPEEIACTLD